MPLLDGSLVGKMNWPVQSVLRRIRPGGRSFWQYPRGTLSASVAADQSGGSWTVVEPAHILKRRPPRQLGSIVVDLQSLLAKSFPNFGVVHLPGASVYTEHGWIGLPGGEFVSDTSWYAHHADEMRVFRKLPPAQRLPGTCVSICTDYAGANPGHLLLDGLTRLHLLEKAGVSLDSVDHILVPETNGNMQALIAQLGVPLDKCIWATDQVGFRPDVLIATSFPGLRRDYPRFVPEFLRSRIRTDGPATRKLYIDRTGNFKRKIVNAERIRQIAVEHGCEVYDPAGKERQAETFAQACVVAGAHSAGLANLAFCQPGTKVLELIPTDHVYPYYYTLAESGDLDYACLAGPSLQHRPKEDLTPSPFDFTVDESEFAAALERL